jgi:lysozyme family protein
VDFDQAFDLLLGHEGGYVDHPRDPGGATRWGITERVARVAGYRGDMREFPVTLAKRIAKAEYWDAVRADQLPPALRYAVFDAAYNSGPTQAAKWLQRALGVVDDGVIGPKTLAAASAASPCALRPRMLAQRLRFMTDLATWPAFGKGWARRIAALMEG